MAGFVRRYTSFPTDDVFLEIEGVVIIDLPPPGSISGVGIGTVALVGEFANMASKLDPVEVYSAQDYLEKCGGFDATLGQVGGDGGNAFIALRNKKFKRLICVPVDLTSGNVRAFRSLPLAASATDTTPATPLVATNIIPPREFKSGSNRVMLAANVSFSSALPLREGTNGETFPAATTATTFDSASAAFVAADVGRVIVVGYSGTGAVNRGTFRIVTVSSATRIVVQKLDGTDPVFTNATAHPWRIYEGAVADTGGTTAIATGAASAVLARAVDATIAAATVLTPTVAPDSTDPLAGLQARVHPTVALTAPIVGYPANSATVDALYVAAIDKMLGDESPERDTSIVVSARSSATIRAKLKEHVLTASQVGLGRDAILSPEVDTTAFATVNGDADPGVGANRHERDWYTWPGHRTFIPEAVGASLTLADASAATDGHLDLASDTLLASIVSNLSFERNPGQAADPVPGLMAHVERTQAGVSGLDLNKYIMLKAKGICALRKDKEVGFVFQSGVTSSLTAGQKNIARRRTADYIEDAVAGRLRQFAKLPLTNALKGSILGEIDAFLLGLFSPNNPAGQKIKAYSIDPTSANTAAREAAGVWIVIGRVTTVPTLDVIGFQAEIGESVVVTTT